MAMASIEQARVNRKAYLAARRAYIEARGDFIEALKTKDEKIISYSATICNHAFDASERAYRKYLGQR